ncbi:MULTISPECIES: hypothetical protein [Halomonas]|uniref:hypothetical protein n=1 Tax=Halomonas TaxID=2745 RepID=UPI001C955D48|nr:MULTISPECIES: hypothetical protein [Halomonas]MBY6207225.1 hypothetical protein [Halomonas sp. DP3Y7-2]MBY6229819.1 hypothetical protein [Halomonas sp. DP3Y7-1]MCA0917849.1 hypothetical protein [Halomonas denitrificans]
MAHPPDIGRPGSIVPDPGESVSATRYRQAPAPRLWPLWLLMLLVVGGLAAGSWWLWQERQRLDQELNRLRGELSNVHARFQAEQGEGDLIAEFERRLDGLESANEALDQRLGEGLAGVENALAEQAQASLDRQEVNAETLQDLDERLSTLSDTLASARSSLAAVERAGDSARGALEARMDRFDDARESFAGRLASVTTRVDEVVSRLDTRLGEMLPRVEIAENRLSEVTRDVEGLRQSRQDVAEEQQALEARIGQRIDAMEDNMASLAADLRDLRQAQLAFSAQLEALR